jgi:DNA-binding MarR family transcriptional regulator
VADAETALPQLERAIFPPILLIVNETKPDLTGCTSETSLTRKRRMKVPERTLKGWMQTLISYVRSGQPDLTNRQMALMLLVYLTPGPHTVRGLANILGVSKPVITRALNTLGSLGYLRRVRDEADRRNVFVAKTNTGQEFLEGFERNIEQEGPPSRRAPKERGFLLQHN